MPIGRIRKCELDIKQNEKVGSGTFADVIRCELKIPCAAKRLKGNAGQKELVEFVREVGNSRQGGDFVVEGADQGTQWCTVLRLRRWKEV
jgi:hypothetical protein